MAADKRGDFVIPDKAEALRESSAGGWRVRELVEPSAHKIKELAERTDQDPLTFGEPGAFELIFSAVNTFARQSGAVQDATAAFLTGAIGGDRGGRSTCDLSSGAMRVILRACKRAASGASDDEVHRCRAHLKACTFLLSWLVQEAEKLHADKAEVAATKKSAAGKSSKKGKAEEAGLFDWDVYREQAALRLQEVLDAHEPEATQSLAPLWNFRAPDERFVLRFSVAALAIFEQPAALKAGATLRDALWRLIALPAIRYEQSEITVSRLLNLILESAAETTTTCVADLVQHILEEHRGVALVKEVLRELSALPATQMADDKTGPKNVSHFMTAFAGRAPLMLAVNMELLQPHLASESYHLRCGAVRTYGQLLEQLAKLQKTSPEEASEIVRDTTAADILRVPLERTTDVSPFVRPVALETLSRLCESGTLADLVVSKSISRADFHEVAEKALQRLKDKNSHVRRKALQLFCKLLDFNPFQLPSLNIKKLQACRDELRERVAAAAAESAAAKASDRDVAEAPSATGADAGTGPDTGRGPSADGPEEQGADAVNKPLSAAEGEGAEATGDHTGDDAEGSALPTCEPTREERELELIEQALEFATVLSGYFRDAVEPLLCSQTDSDVEEATKATVCAHWIELDCARPAAILNLVFSTKEKVKEAALQAAQSVYLQFTGVPRLTLEQVHSTSRRLLNLVRDASLAELTSLEKIVCEWQRKSLLPTTLMANLWDIVQSHRSASDHSPALALLNMAAIADAKLLSCKRDLLIEQAKSQAQALEKKQDAKLDLTFSRHLCIALLRCASVGDGFSHKEARAVTGTMEKLLVHEPPLAQAGVWYATAEQAIANLFAYGKAPEKLCTSVLQRMSSMLHRDAVCPAALSRLLFCLGQVAIKTIVHIEQCEKMLTRSNEPPVAPAKGDSRKKGATAEPDEDDAEAAAKDARAAEEEAAKEDLERWTRGLLDPASMLGAWVPLIESVCVNENGHFGPELRSSAVVTLCRFMCLSADFCEDHLQLLFSVMESEPDMRIRANIAIALGELAGLHQNVVDPWLPNLYRQLAKSKQPEPRVRKNVMTVLTHLLLSGKIGRPKNQESEEGSKSGAAELALRLVDEDKEIRSSAKLFFSEFSKKHENNIYNLLPDVVSSLARDSSLKKDDFREVISFLVPFVKGKLNETMVSKLCERFTLLDEAYYLRSIAFCVCELQHTEKSVRKLIELKKAYRNRLGDDEVKACFDSLVARLKKSSELKDTAGALEDVLSRSKASDADDDDVADDEPVAEPREPLGQPRADVKVAPAAKEKEKAPAAKPRAKRGKAKA